MKPSTRTITTAPKPPYTDISKTWAFSPMPPSTKSLLRKAFKRGVAFARKRMTA